MGLFNTRSCSALLRKALKIPKPRIIKSHKRKIIWDTWKTHCYSIVRSLFHSLWYIHHEGVEDEPRETPSSDAIL